MKRLKFLGIVVLILGVSAYVYDQNQKEQRLKEQAYQAAISVSEVSTKTVEEWLNFVDRRLGKVLIPKEGHLVLTDDFLNGVTIISTSPAPQFYAYCEPLLNEISIHFGTGEDAPYVDLLWPSSSETPTLPVHPDSIAAKQLFADLCGSIVYSVQSRIKYSQR